MLRSEMELVFLSKEMSSHYANQQKRVFKEYFLPEQPQFKNKDMHVSHRKSQGVNTAGIGSIA
jgi:hypothetical protein